MNNIKYFKSTIILSLLFFPLSLYFGGLSSLYIVSTLLLLEIFVSIDTAIINAKYLTKINKGFKKYLLSNQTLIIMLSLRILIPIILILITTDLNLITMFNFSINDINSYEMTIRESMPIISAFGGSFLLMIFLDFFFKKEREIEWIKILENNKYINNIKEVNYIEIFIVIFIGLIITTITQDYKVIIAYMFGIMLNLSLNYLDKILNLNHNKKLLIKNGIIGLVYFTILERSLNFDNILMSFAITNNILIILTSLVLSVVFIRDFINFSINKKILKKFTYLERGVNYVIGFLSIIFILKIFIFIPDLFIGVISLLLILSSIYSSYYFNKKNIELLKEKE